MGAPGDRERRPDGPLADPPPLLGSPHRGLLGRLRGYFLAGLVVAAPIGITVGLAVWLVDFVDRHVFPAGYNPDDYLPFPIPGFGILIAVATLTAIGWLASSVVGRMIHSASERLLDRIPIVRGIYAATKQIFQSVLAQRSSAFRQVALIEYPRRGVWSIGFLTGTTAGEVQHRTREETVNVFLPTTPNPTSGYLLFVPRKDLIVLDMTIEEGIKMVVSGGIVTPPHAASDAGPADAAALPADDAGE